MLNSTTKKVLTVALAASVLFSAQAALTSTWAATKKVSPPKTSTSAKKPATPAKKPAAPTIKINKVNMSIDGANQSLETISVGGATLVNAATFTKPFGVSATVDSKAKTIRLKKATTTITLKADDKSATVNTAKTNLKVVPKMVSNKLFADASQLAAWFGGEVLKDAAGKHQFFTFKLLAGVVNPHWIDANQILVSKETDAGFDHYIVHTTTRKATKLNITVVTDNIVPSPDGKSLAYTDDNSVVYVYTLATNTEKAITADTTEKLELQWASDNLSLFYIDGPSSNVIAQINVADGTITKIVDDKVNYKSDLYVHPNNKFFVYTVTKTAKVTSDTSGIKEGEELPDFDVTIDPAGTEPQLYFFDSSTLGNTPKVLTTTLDNKTYATLLDDGTVAYLSTNTADEQAVPVLKLISPTGNQTTVLLADTELYDLKTVNNKLIALGYTSDDKQFVFEIDVVRGSAKRVAATPLDIVTVTLGSSTSQMLAADGDGRLAVWNANAWTKVTN